MKSRSYILTAIMGVNLLLTMINTHALAEIQSVAPVCEAAEQIEVHIAEVAPIKAKTSCEPFSEAAEAKQDVANYKVWKSVTDNIDSDQEFLEIPNEDTSFKTYMSHKALTNKKSIQYKMQQDAWTDEYGLRRYGDAYMVAMGTFYAQSCGEYFNVTLENGNTFTVVTGDIKDDRHTDDRNMYSPVYSDDNTVYANVVEFIVDTSAVPESVLISGSVGSIDYFSGCIFSIEKVNDCV